MSNFMPPLMDSPSWQSSAVATSIVRGVSSRWGSVTMDQFQALVTAVIQQMGGMLADALKNVKIGQDNHDFTSGVNVEVQLLKDDRH